MPSPRPASSPQRKGKRSTSASQDEAQPSSNGSLRPSHDLALDIAEIKADNKILHYKFDAAEKHAKERYEEQEKRSTERHKELEKRTKASYEELEKRSNERYEEQKAFNEEQKTFNKEQRDDLQKLKANDTVNTRSIYLLIALVLALLGIVLSKI